MAILFSLQATEAANAKARERIAESRLLLGQFLINDLRLDIQSRGMCLYRGFCSTITKLTIIRLAITC